MVDSLAMFFGAKKRKSSPSRKRRDSKSHGSVVVRGKERKLYKGINGGLFYKTKSGRTYVDSKFVRAHSPRRVRRASPKRRRASPKRRRASPKRRVRRASPKRRVRRSPLRMRKTRYGYGLGQPSLLDMMGPAGLGPHHHHNHHHKQHLIGPGGEPPIVVHPIHRKN